MKSFLISAMHSGAGKTVTSCALMAALKKRGLCVRAFKAGPDYIDPMFHSRLLGLDSRNLDLFLQGEDGVRRSFSSAAGADVAVVEGAMGYYDGLGGTTEASAWALAACLDIPTLLVLRPKGSGLTLAAQVRGLLDFRPESRIAALLLADCPARLAASLGPLLTRETGLPVLGFLPPMPEARIESRHLGLLTARELTDLSARFEALGRQAERSVELDALLALAADKRCAAETDSAKPVTCRIAVASDEAFCFTYADGLDALRRAGAELAFFSPLRDAALPADADGLYLPGGYPELYAGALAENELLRAAIRDAVRSGLPTVAECGGFLCLGQSLEDAEGRARPMCGALPGCGFKTGRLQRFGYLTLGAAEDSLLFRAGEKIPAHEFHYWDSTENGAALHAEEADGRTWRCGYVSPTLYAAFPHLHFGGETPLAARFVRACERWKASMT